MTAIERTFKACREEDRLAFMPFLTAGDPDVSTTCAAIDRLGRAGVDLIEIGFPYSDPIADGPVIQASYTRALDRGVRVPNIFEGLATIGDGAPPRIAMVSYAIVYRLGVEEFCRRAKTAGLSGLIVPDLPGTDAAETGEAIRGAGLDLIQLVAPTTPRARAARIVQSCSGFVYCVAVAGITGERAKISEALHDQLKWLREETDLPLAVGFGISKPEHVEDLRDRADGVIVGSGIVRRMEAGGEAALDSVEEFARTMVAACRRG